MSFLTLNVIIAAVAGYLCGSIPFGLVLGRLCGLGDIRETGSGNIGATNMLRAGGKKLAAATLLCDALKGAVPVLILRFTLGETEALVAGCAAIIGHIFPVWLKFRGGKGVATTLGTLLAISWQVGLAACATWLAVAALFRISSLSALVATALAPLYAVLMGMTETALFLMPVTIVVWARHRENIRRLLKDEEPRIGRKKAEEGGAS